MSRDNVRRSLRWNSNENEPPVSPSVKEICEREASVVVSRMKSPRRKILQEKQILEQLEAEEEHDDTDGRMSPVYDLIEPPKMFVLQDTKSEDKPKKSNERRTPAKSDSRSKFANSPRCSRRLSLAAAPSTPTRRSRRLSAAAEESTPSRGQSVSTPTRTSRRLSEIHKAEENRVETPTRSSRRLSHPPKRFRPDEESDADEQAANKAKKLKTVSEQKQTVSVPISGSRKCEATKIEKPLRLKNITREEMLAQIESPDNDNDSDFEMKSEDDNSDSGEEEDEEESPEVKPQSRRQRSARKSAQRSTKDKIDVNGKSRRGTPAKRSTAGAQRRTMTPRIPVRNIPIPASANPLQEAQLRLHVAAVPDNLPCRENEFAEIFSFTESKIQDGIGGCMYISGVPGTGKTATVREVMRQLKSMVDDGDLPCFDFIEINGMRLTDPNQAYVQIWKAMSDGQKVTAEHAKNLLEQRFTVGDESKKSNQQMTVLLVDELDMLWNRKQSVLYNIFEWPTHKSAKLVVLAIANTMDLPERVMINRVSSRVGLTRLTFAPYNHQQLQEIVTTRLSGLSVFDHDAIQLVARKVASLSGDARRALDICRRAVELAQREFETQVAPSTSKAKAGSSTFQVHLRHVTAAHQEMFCSPKILAIRHCSPIEKMFLRCLVTIFQKTGIEETSLVRVFRMTNELAALDGKEAISEAEFHFTAGRLSSSRLILVEPGKWGRLDMKIRLNISQDDVTFALQDKRSDV